MERNADVILNACKDVGLAVNTGKSRYMEIGRHRGMTSNEHFTVGINAHEKVKIFKYLDSLLTNQNYIHREIKCRLTAENSCYYSVLTLFSD
jgi:hypothetical protein